MTTGLSLRVADMVFTPRVFISDSASESEAAALCQALSDRFTERGFEVFWDSNLQTSQSWRAVIDEWIWRCDAAVLVLSEAATQSRYVAYEAAMLRQRWRHGFPLIPIWCPNVSEKVLTDRMGAPQIAEIETNLKMLEWPANFDRLSERTEEILKTLVADRQPTHDIEENLLES